MTLKLIRSPKEATADAALIEEARNHCYDHWDKVVLEAFETGKKCYPRTFEYGLAAGNYAGHIEANWYADNPANRWTTGG